MKKNNSTIKKPKSLRRNSALGGSLLVAGMSSLGMSQAVIADEGEYELDTLKIEERTIDTNPYAEEGAPYKAKISGDERRVRPLAETPATISVLTQTQLQDSGRTDLREVLAGQPGITLGTGENGNAFGDRYVIRGHEARSDVFVDGLRDPGMTTRESFAVEQIEITKGPSSTFAGRGSSGGAVNSVTKQASSEYDFTKAQLGLGTDSYYRLTLDANQKINDDVALRANVLVADEDVPDRSPAARKRQGLALSGLFSASDKLDILADLYYLDAQDKPDLGTYIDRTTFKPASDTPVYLQDEDFLNSQINTGTVRVKYEFNDKLRLTNALRYGTTENEYMVTGTRAGTRDETDPVAPGAATLTASTHQGWQDVSYLVNQSNLFLNAGKHELMFSLELSSHETKNGVFSYDSLGETNCILPPGRRNPEPSAGYCLLDGDGNPVDNINGLLQRDITKGSFDSDQEVTTTSVAVMDTVDISEKIDLFFGVRIDSFDYSNAIPSRSDDSVASWEYSDTLWNGHLGVVYDIVEDLNVYFTYSTATNINGGESDVGANCGYGGLCGVQSIVGDSKPEKVENIELGSKWNLLDDKLLFTASYFQITKSDVMESLSGHDYESDGFLNTGENRVNGFEFSLVGNITDKLSTQMGLALMKAEVTKSVNEEGIGRTLANFADDSAYLQLRYQALENFAIGGAFTYSSEMYSGQPDTAAGWNNTINDYSIIIPSYGYFDLFAQYDYSDQTKLRVNVGNVTDEDYYLAAYRSGSFTYIGDARRVTLTLEHEF